jgi:hypothetical protein
VIGVGIDLFSGTFPAGTNDVLDVTFTTSPATNQVTATVNFSGTPSQELIVNQDIQPLPALFVPGAVVISPNALEGDVSPQPNGDEVLNIADWVQEGRFVAGLDTPANGSEFQRADCAPRSTLGDGQITVADWVQVGRYAVGLDPITPAGGPTSPSGGSGSAIFPTKLSSPDQVQLLPLTGGAATNSVVVQLTARGTEAGLGFSVTFDPANVRFLNAALGSGATGAALIQNTNSALKGTVGFVVGMEPPATFAAGTQQLLTLHFASVLYSNNAVLSFGSNPVTEQLVDSNANVLPAAFQNAALPLGGAAWPTVSITQTGNGLGLSWPSSATNLTLMTAPSLSGPWTAASQAALTNGNVISANIQVSTNQAFYRLQSP